MIIALDAMGEIMSSGLSPGPFSPRRNPPTLVLTRRGWNHTKQSWISTTQTSRFSVVLEVITMDDPTAAIRADSSIITGADLVKRRSRCTRSAGIPVACCVLKFGRLPGIDRPPSPLRHPPNSKFVLLDSGARRPNRMLNQFSIMGDLRKDCTRQRKPRAGLFSNGSEDGREMRYKSGFHEKWLPSSAMWKDRLI